MCASTASCTRRYKGRSAEVPTSVLPYFPWPCIAQLSMLYPVKVSQSRAPRTHLFERVLDNLLLVEVGYAWEQIPHSRLCLRVNLRLCLGQLPVVGPCVDLFANSVFRFFKNGAANVVAHPVDV